MVSGAGVTGAGVTGAGGTGAGASAGGWGAGSWKETRRVGWFCVRDDWGFAAGGGAGSAAGAGAGSAEGAGAGSAAGAGAGAGESGLSRVGGRFAGAGSLACCSFFSCSILSWRAFFSSSVRGTSKTFSLARRSYSERRSSSVILVFSSSIIFSISQAMNSKSASSGVMKAGSVRIG